MGDHLLMSKAKLCKQLGPLLCLALCISVCDSYLPDIYNKRYIKKIVARFVYHDPLIQN